MCRSASSKLMTIYEVSSVVLYFFLWNIHQVVQKIDFQSTGIIMNNPAKLAIPDNEIGRRDHPYKHKGHSIRSSTTIATFRRDPQPKQGRAYSF